jgi:hypothetical protein
MKRGRVGTTGVEVAASTRTPYRTTDFMALDFTFRIESSSEALRDHLQHLYTPLQTKSATGHTYRFIDAGPPPRGSRYFAFLDDELLTASTTPTPPMGYLLWHINNQAVTTTSTMVLVHAAAAAANGRAVVLPAPAESGKTTLVAGLVTRGLEYLTDEAVALRLDDDDRVVPYPKPLTIEPGSRQVLAHLEPRLDDDVADHFGDQWHLSPEAIRASAVAGPATPCLLIVPRFDRDGPTALTALKRAEALRLVAEGSFNLPQLGRPGLLSLARLVRSCECYRLAVADLDNACDLILERLDREGVRT